MDYADLRALHVGCALASVSLFLFRLLLAARGGDYRTRGALRWVPHAVDSVLLASAVGLAVWSAQYPFVQAWLTAKVVLLPLYIIAAAIALDLQRPLLSRRLAALTACLLLTQIVVTARTRDPLLIVQIMQ